jgi:hypothetical protein
MTDAAAGVHRGAGEHDAWPVVTKAQVAAMPVMVFSALESRVIANETYSDAQDASLKIHHR